MAYSIILTTAIASTRTTATNSDGTVFGTGGNPARASVRVYSSGFQMAYNNIVATTLTLTPNATPDAATSWSYTFGIDGWYKFYYVIIKQAYSSIVTYNIYDAVYDGSNNVYRSKVGSNLGNALSNTTYWESIADPSSLANNNGESNESVNIESTIYQRILIPNAQYGFANIISETSESCCGDCDQVTELQQYNLIADIVDGALVDDERSLLPQGEKKARRLQALLLNC